MGSGVIYHSHWIYRKLLVINPVFYWGIPKTRLQTCLSMHAT